jgi:hypothetical protein
MPGLTKYSEYKFGKFVANMDGIDIMFILINSWNISYKLLCMGLVEFSNMI